MASSGYLFRELERLFEPATFENGLLTVQLPKTEPASEGTEIEIA
jgi:HSP20 family molecular chaperone IbpA